MAVTYDNGYQYDQAALTYDGLLLIADGHGRPTIGVFSSRPTTSTDGSVARVGVFASSPTTATHGSAAQVGGQSSRPELT